MSSIPRREFLKQAGGTIAACALSAIGPAAGQGEPAGPAATLPALADRPSSLHLDPAIKSVVADVRAREVVADAVIHENLLREMIDEAVRLATRTDNPGQGWNQLIKRDDVIGIKFNSIGQEAIGTTQPFAAQLLESLRRADISPDRIMLIEVPERLTREFGTRRCPIGFAGGKVSFGSGEDELAAVLQEVSAIINVPFLKTHNIAQMTGCLKNLSHALIRSPRLCHANHCSPFVGDILALPQIRPKLRIHIVNALRAVFDGGPLPGRQGLWTHGGILVSTDPVAADQVGADILNEQRLARGLPTFGDREGHVPHVHAAGARGLGTDDQDYIQLLEPALF